MNPRYKKIYCCTPVAFAANEHFFIRDTGLISRTLQSMGIESKCIMPLPYHDSDQREGIIRTEYKNLRSVSWWKSLGIDAVILYSWGAPKYIPIARAIKKAGVKLMIHMDTSGDFEGWRWPHMNRLSKIYRYLKIQIQDCLRSLHLKYADIITAGAPVLTHISNRRYFGKWIEERGFPMSNPISPHCKYNGAKKLDIILCIGRWNDKTQKRPEMMMDTLSHYYQKGGQAITKIYGTITDDIRQWHSTLSEKIAQKIHLIGYVNNAELIGEYSSAKIILCPSRHEGSHIVSAEALCCGCSVVVSNLPAPLRTVHWYTTKNSGTISQKDTSESLAEAIIDELNAWAQGKRNAEDIAKAWHPYFHADKVLNQIFSH